MKKIDFENMSYWIWAVLAFILVMVVGIFMILNSTVEDGTPSAMKHEISKNNNDNDFNIMKEPLVFDMDTGETTDRLRGNKYNLRHSSP